MTKPKPSFVEYSQAHRAAYALALEQGITIRQAEEKLRHQAAMERHREAAKRLAAKMAAPIRYGPRHEATDEAETGAPDQPWMMRD